MAYRNPRRQSERDPIVPHDPTSPSADDGPALRVQAPSERLAALSFSHARLLKAIALKKGNLDKLNAQIDESSRRMGALGPLRDQVMEIDDSIHKMFVALLARRRQPREVRRAVASVYEMLQDMEVISQRDPWVSELDDLAAEIEEDFDARGFDNQAPPPSDAGGFSAKRPSDAPEDQSLRGLFRRLAMAVHPDRVHDEAEKARRTEAMKEISRAYEDRDLARLLTLERIWLTEGLSEEIPLDEEERRFAQLERLNRDLAIQLKTLTQEIKQTRRSPPGQMNTHLRREMRESGSDPIETMAVEVKQAVTELQSVRDFVAGYAEGRLTLEELLRGPVRKRKNDRGDSARVARGRAQHNR